MNEDLLFKIVVAQPVSGTLNRLDETGQKQHVSSLDQRLEGAGEWIQFIRLWWELMLGIGDALVTSITFFQNKPSLWLLGANRHDQTSQQEMLYNLRPKLGIRGLLQHLGY